MAPRLEILVRAPNWIGDQILAFPFFYFLRRAYPQARIVSVCVDWVTDIQFRGQVDEVFVMPKAESASLIERFKKVDEGARALRGRGRWDLAFSLPNSISSAWLLYRSGARMRRGYAVEGRGFFLTERLKWDSRPSRHRAQAYLDLLPDSAKPDLPAKEFWGTPPETELDSPTQGVLQSFDAEHEWPTVGPISPPADPYWILAPGAQADSRRWPMESFRELARLVRRATGLKGLVIGGPKETAMAEELSLEKELGLENFADRGPVAGLWKIFRGAKFSVSNESGLAHVAALCGSPVQVVCGAADPRRTRPLGPGKVQVKVNPVDCWPCERNVCFQPAVGQIKCLRGISPEEVWEEIRLGFGV